LNSPELKEGRIARGDDGKINDDEEDDDAKEHDDFPINLLNTGWIMCLL
jgi:hypothetical protein